MATSGSTDSTLIFEGSRFGYLVVERPEGDKPLCRCLLCGGTSTPNRSNLRRGSSTRCPACARKSGAFKRRKYRASCSDEDRRRLLNRIYAAIGRCTDPFNRAYANYGGRGIDVYLSWVENPGAFLDYLLAIPGWDDPKQTLDRIDNDAGYVPGNLRFRTHREQQSNRQDTLWIEHSGRKLTLQEFHREYAPGYARRHTIARKLREGLTPERVIAEQHDVSRGAYGPRTEPAIVRYAGKDWTPYSLWKGPAAGYLRVRDIVRQIEKGLDGDAIVADQHAYNGRSGPGVRPPQLRAA